MVLSSFLKLLLFEMKEIRLTSFIASRENILKTLS